MKETESIPVMFDYFNFELLEKLMNRPERITVTLAFQDGRKEERHGTRKGVCIYFDDGGIWDLSVFGDGVSFPAKLSEQQPTKTHETKN